MTSTTPPSGEYLIALDSRFAITWAIRARSPTATTRLVAATSSIRCDGLWPAKRRTCSFSRSVDRERLAASTSRSCSSAATSRKSSIRPERRFASRWTVPRISSRASVVQFPGPQQLGVAQHAGQRRAQLVRDGRHQVGLQLLDLALARDVAQAPRGGPGARPPRRRPAPCSARARARRPRTRRRSARRPSASIDLPRGEARSTARRPPRGADRGADRHRERPREPLHRGVGEHELVVEADERDPLADAVEHGGVDLGEPVALRQGAGLGERHRGLPGQPLERTAARRVERPRTDAAQRRRRRSSRRRGSAAGAAPSARRASPAERAADAQTGARRRARAHARWSTARARAPSPPATTCSASRRGSSPRTAARVQRVVVAPALRVEHADVRARGARPGSRARSGPGRRARREEASRSAKSPWRSARRFSSASWTAVCSSSSRWARASSPASASSVGALLEGDRLQLELRVLALELPAVLFQRARHRVEGATEPPDLVAAALRDRDVELAAPDALRGVGEPPDRHHDPARDERPSPAPARARRPRGRARRSAARGRRPRRRRRRSRHRERALRAPPAGRSGAIRSSARAAPSEAEANARPAPTPSSRVRAITGSA